MNLIWTSEQPTKPGWYWMKLTPSELPTIVLVYQRHSTIYCEFDGLHRKLSRMPERAKWSNAPIQEPKEAE